jgi:hypothetical protein
VLQRCRLRTFFWSNAKKDSMAALSPAEATCPMDPTRWWVLSAVRNFLERNWLPLLE